MAKQREVGDKRKSVRQINDCSGLVEYELRQSETG